MSDSGNDRILEFSGQTHDMITSYDLHRDVSLTIQLYDILLDESEDHMGLYIMPISEFVGDPILYRLNATG